MSVKELEDKKEQEQQNRDKLIELQEIENKNSPGRIELNKIKEKLKKKK